MGRGLPSQAPGGPTETRPGCAGARGIWRETRKVSGYLRVSGEAEGCREDPIPWQAGPPSQQRPTALCRHLPFSCCFSRICSSERPGEHSRTIKYSFCGSCSIYTPMFIQQTFSEGPPRCQTPEDKRLSHREVKAVLLRQGRKPGLGRAELHAGRQVLSPQGPWRCRDTWEGHLSSQRGLQRGWVLSGRETRSAGPGCCRDGAERPARAPTSRTARSNARTL